MKKITDDDRIKICNDYLDGMSYLKITEKYKISSWSVWNTLNKNNIKFHIDTACLDLSGGDYSKIFESQKHRTKSIHISSKNLASVYGDKKIGSFISSQLADYSGNMSLELLNLSLSDIKKNVNFVFSNLQKGSNI